MFGKYSEQAKVVLEALLEKFADHGVQDIEDAKVLDLPPCDQFDSKKQIRRGIFGGVETVYPSRTGSRAITLRHL